MAWHGWKASGINCSYKQLTRRILLLLLRAIGLGYEKQKIIHAMHQVKSPLLEFEVQIQEKKVEKLFLFLLNSIPGAWPSLVTNN
jgi:hypothetical protein